MQRRARFLCGDSERAALAELVIALPLSGRLLLDR